MNGQIEKRPFDEAFKGIITNAEDLRKIALKCLEKGYLNAQEYELICDKNSLLVF